MSEPTTIEREKQGADSVQRACSAESDLWHEYLQSQGYTGYEGLCKCWACQTVRELYPEWKAERARRMQPNDKISV